MKPPDVVSAAHELYSSTASSPRYDMLKRPRIPAAMYAMELEWNRHPVPMGARIILTSRTIGLWLVVAFCVVSFLLEPVLRIYGAGLCSPATYPVVFFISAIFALVRLARTASLREAGWRFVLPQAFFIVLEWTFSPGIDSHWRLALVLLATLFVGYLADQINTHCLRLVTASLFMDREQTLAIRELWDLRFNWLELGREISELESEIPQSDDEEEVAMLKRRVSELRTIRRYPLVFLAVSFSSVLCLLGAPPVAIIVFGALVALLAWRHASPDLDAVKLSLRVTLHSFVSWLSWETQQHWVHSPGMFRDGLYSRFRRVAQTVACFVLIQFAFVPRVYPWEVGVELTPLALWKLAFTFFVNLMFPALFLGCALAVTTAHSSWMNAVPTERGNEYHGPHRSEEFLLG